MTDDQTPPNPTPLRAPYEQPVVIELNVAGETDGKTNVFGSEVAPSFGPS